MRYFAQKLFTEESGHQVKARNPNHAMGLGWVVVCLLIAIGSQVKAQTAPASITVSGACLSGTYVLAKYADNYESTGKPAYEGTGSASIGGTTYSDLPIAIYYEPAGPAWVMTFHGGGVYQSNPSTAQLPPMSGWVAEDAGVGSCQGSDPLNVLGTSGTVSITPSVVDPLCAGSPVSLTATPTNLASPITYSWSSNPAGFSGSGANLTQNAPSVSTNTNFVITVTATSGGSSATASVGITVNPAPVLVAGGPTDPTTCGSSDGSIAFTTTNLPNGNYSLTYTGPGSPKMVTVNNNAFTLTGLPAGSYSNFSISNNGCTGLESTFITLSEPPAPTADLTNNGPLSCAQTSVTLTASGGNTYAFSSGASQLGGSSGNMATVTTAGTYSVVVTGVNGCTALAQTTVSGDGSAGLTTFYADADGDSFGNPNSTTVVCSLTPPAGFVANNADCDDTKRLYADGDGDGVGTGPAVACGVATNTDCDDNNPNLQTPQTYYADADGDSFGNPNSTTAVCSLTPPAGFVTNNADCDDTNAANVPISITGQPGNLSVEQKQEATFRVSAMGSSLTYQWYFNGTTPAHALKKENSATLTLKNVKANDAGTYYVRVTGNCGSDLSSGATLTVSSKKSRQAAPEPAFPLEVTVLGNPLVGSQLKVVVTGAQGLPLQLQLTNLSGRIITQQHVEQAGAVETRQLEVVTQSVGLLLLRVSTPTQSQVVKIIRQ